MARIVDRLTSDDLMSLATDRGRVPMQIGAVIMLDTADGCSPAALVAVIESHLPAVARLRQRLVRPAFGLGRPYWADDPDFAIARQVDAVECPTGQGRVGLLALAADLLRTRLGSDRPLWALRIVTNVAAGRTGVVFVCHHVLADGIGGLGILAALMGTESLAADPAFPRPAPLRAQLFFDAVGRKLTSIMALPRAALRFSQGLAELVRAIPKLAQWSTLNQPIGTQGTLLVTVSTDLSRVQDAAHAHHATVNDLALCAITGALASLLAQRGEFADAIVVSVPFSSRAGAAASSMGNHSGAVPLRLPARGDLDDRIAAITQITKTAKSAPRGASTAVLGPMFRGLARLGLFQHFVDNQTLVHTFVTNVRGPRVPLTLGGAPILELVPMTTTMGNVTLSFAILSYVDRLTITIVADRATCPDVQTLKGALERELRLLTGVPTNG